MHASFPLAAAVSSGAFLASSGFQKGKDRGAGGEREGNLISYAIGGRGGGANTPTAPLPTAHSPNSYTYTLCTKL